MSNMKKFDFTLGAMVLTVIAVSSVSGMVMAGQANSGTGGGSSAPTGQDYNPAEHTVVSGTFRVKKPEEPKVEGEPEDLVGYLSSALEYYKVTSSNDTIIAQLKARDGKKISVEGKLNEKTNTVAVSKVLEGVLPPAEQKNPRGL